MLKIYYRSISINYNIHPLILYFRKDRELYRHLKALFTEMLCE